MNKKLRQNEQGLAHVLVIVLVIVVIAVVAFAGWKVMSSKSSSSPTATVTNKAAASATKSACMTKYNDGDLCAFVAAETASPFEKTAAKITITGTSNNSASDITLSQDGKGNQSFALTGGGQTITTVIYNNQTYTQETAGGPWVTSGPNSSTNTDTSSSPDSTLSDFLKSASTTSYTKIGTEACGNLKCFKYQVKDSTAPNATQYVWFDTKDHLLRQYYYEDSGAGDKMTMTISYQAVSISKPSPVQDISAGTGQ